MMDKSQHNEEIAAGLTGEEEIYRENILDHYKNPHNKRALSACTAQARELNPICGDEITVFLDIADGKVKDASFTGHGCAISQAAISMLTDEIKDRPVKEIKNIESDDIYKLLGIPISVTRIKCALLSLKTVQGAIKNHEHA
jgi:nitrogen fixation NifU-like protein